MLLVIGGKHMRIFKCFCLVIILVVLGLCSCDYDEKNKEVLSVSDYQESHLSIDTTTYMYTDKQLSSIIQYKGTMSELIVDYPTNYIDEIESCYRVIYYGENSAAVVLFDNDKNILVAQTYSLLHEKSVYENLQIGHHLNDVQILDPGGEYFFLHTGRNDIPKISTHYSIDKYIIKITYDENNLITNIDIESLLFT